MTHRDERKMRQGIKPRIPAEYVRAAWDLRRPSSQTRIPFLGGTGSGSEGFDWLANQQDTGDDNSQLRIVEETAPARLVTAQVERGQFVRAYQDAKALVDRHPEKASAHFALSYVLRYGGAIEESARECD